MFDDFDGLDWLIAALVVFAALYLVAQVFRWVF